MNIYEKMLKATEEISIVAKNLVVGAGTKASYKAVGEADVLNAVKPIEAKNGIYSYPVSRKIVDTNVFTTTSEYNGKTTEKNNLFMRVETVYRFVNTEKPDEFIDITTYGDGVDSQDKAPGKAMTYGDKYALLKAYKIQTGDDPDQDASQDGKFNKKDTPTKKEERSQAKAETKSIDEIKVKSLQDLIDKKGTNAIAICQHYKVNSLADMTVPMWQHAMNLLQAKKDVEKVDLGL